MSNSHQQQLKQLLVLCFALTFVLFFFTKCNDSISKSTKSFIREAQTSFNQPDTIGHRPKSRLRILYAPVDSLQRLFSNPEPIKLILQFVKTRNGELTLFVWKGNRKSGDVVTGFDNGFVLYIGRKSDGEKIKNRNLIISNMEISDPSQLTKLKDAVINKSYPYICFVPVIQGNSGDLGIVKYELWGSSCPDVDCKANKSTPLNVDPNPSPPHQAN